MTVVVSLTRAEAAAARFIFFSLVLCLCLVLCFTCPAAELSCSQNRLASSKVFVLVWFS